MVTSTSPLIEVLAGMKGKTISDVRSPLEAGRTLEIAAGQIAATRLSDEDFEQLQQMVEALTTLFDNPQMFFETDVTFHLSLASRTTSKVIANYLHDVFKRLAQIRAQYPVAHVELQEALENQRRLFAALESRDRDRILVAIDQHLAAFELVMLGQKLDFLPVATAGSRYSAAPANQVLA
jgi:DNA-binding FadR family transcriptional regulator